MAAIILPQMLSKVTRTPRTARAVAYMVVIAIVLSPFALYFVPWTQNVHGKGKAVAFNPVFRPQVVDSPIQGRVKKWNVVEGDKVKMGQKLVELTDVDANRLDRLIEEEKAILSMLSFVEDRVEQHVQRINSIKQAQAQQISIQKDQLLNAESEKLRVKQQIVGAEASEVQLKINFERNIDLEKKGTITKLDLERSEREFRQATASLVATRELLTIADRVIKIATDRLTEIRNTNDALIAGETASLNGAKAERERVFQQRIDIATRVERQRAQFVVSPCDGTVFRQVANADGGGQLVKIGDPLVIIVPDVKTSDSLNPEVNQGFMAAGGVLAATALEELTPGKHPGIVAELIVSGNDLPLIQKGDRVRLQFEGWPAVQFVGWPSVAVGSFGGKVYLIDPTNSEAYPGMFRILVEPDPQDRPWPNDQYLRQGVRCQGWVLLNDVKLGWEVWRQLNGFPATRTKPANASSEKSK